MSIVLTKSALRKFISTSDPEIIALQGKWGVGKTYTWQLLLKEAISTASVGLPRYAYVSLFGTNSIDDVRQSIFENIESTRGETATLEDRLRDFGRGASKKIIKYAPHAKIPYLNNYVDNLAGGFRHIVAESVKETLICIDDIERKGKNLSVSDIFGLANQLKETRKCKIIFVLNREALDDNEKESFTLYFEKVVDAWVDFDPTPEEAIEIALPEADEISQWLRVNCVDLKISNIRIIRRTLRACAQFNEIVAEVSAEARRDMVRSLTLLAWAVFVPKDAPPVDFIAGWGFAQYVALDKKEMTAEEAGWARILRQYNFTHFDDLDRAMVDGIRKGYFDEGRIAREAEKVQEVRRKAEGDAGLSAAWRRYHDSFDQDEEAVANELCDGNIQYINYLSELNLNWAYTILDGIGYPDKAEKLLRAFIQEFSCTPSMFDLATRPFGGEVTNPKIREAFEAQVKANPSPLPSPSQAAKAIYKGGWSPEDERALAELSAAEFEALFRKLRGDELISVVQGALEFRKIVNATPEQKAITAKAIEALKRIADDSALNKFRMKKFGL
jgi:hypothetical protein